MARFSIVFGVSALALTMPTAAQAQRDGGGYVDIYWEEEPEAEEAKPEPVRFVGVVTPAVYTYGPPQYIYNVVETIKRPPPPPPRYTAQSIYPFEDRLLDQVTARQMETFTGERDFDRYVKTLKEIKDDSDAEWAAVQRTQGQPILIAAATMQDAQEDVCIDAANCPEEEAGDVVVTAQRVSSSSMASVSAVNVVSTDSITNVQSMGVDEGDIVKQIGKHLLILQDGRIFAVNIKDMKLTDRADVYRRDGKDIEGADWYDEMLVQGDHIIITAYSYQDDASEVSVFKLDQASGKISPRGVFLINSDDYYSSKNYATRIVGDKLVVYTPGELETFEDRDERPKIRRWLSMAERKKWEEKTDKDWDESGKPVLDVRSLYKPVLRTANPFIHTVSICPLGDFETSRTLACRSTGFIGPRNAEMFVSTENVYLWNAPSDELGDVNRDECVANRDWDKPYPVLPRAERKDVIPGAVYRLPVHGGEPTVIGVSGAPYDQFSMDERDGRFRALADWRTIRCIDSGDAPAEVAFLSVHQSVFSREFQPLFDGQFNWVPSPNKRIVENRFADDWLVYGGRDSWSSSPPYMDDEDDAALAAKGTRVVAVPVKKPRAAQVINLPHNIIRTERVGNDMLVNGYRDDKGLNMTLIGLGETAKVASTLFLKDRYETEGRSHAFNASLYPDGRAILAVPTAKRKDESGRWWWRSESSDISFATKNSAGTLGDAGALLATPKDKVETHKDYECEVSCIDWYGNSRPVFTGGRIFGLMGTALVEAELADGQVREKARIDLTVPLSGTSTGH